MFTSQKPGANKVTKKPSSTRDSAVTILTSGCHFNGKLYCRGSSRIGGRIEGEVVSEGLLIIEESAMITAKITADETVIQGCVKGKLLAKGKVELTSTSRFEGDISTPILVVNEGAQFNGQSHMQLDDKDLAGSGRFLESVPAAGEKGPDATPQPGGNEVEKQPEVAVLRVSEVPTS